MKNFTTLLFSFFLTTLLFAGKVDTISVYSKAMHKNIRCVVISPDAYKKKATRFPVVYLLHGYDGNYSNWIMKVPEIKTYADTYQSIIVCPDGAIASWYFDSPVDTAYRYETYIGSELVNYMDTHYRTLADRKHRAVTGLSMGGHGALYLALRHADVFGAAGSMSGVVDLLKSNNRYEISKRIGDTVLHAGEWHNRSILNLVEQYNNTPVRIIFDCGNRDGFAESNRRLHLKMIALGIPHDYTERSGEHSWEYWKNALPYHLLFFRRFFDL